MTVVLYDGSFNGLLTAVFEVYEYKFGQVSICREDPAPGSLFGTTHTVITNTGKCSRVYKKLQEQLTPAALKQLYDSYLSELKDIENVILRYIQYALQTKQPIENNYAHPDVLVIKQTSKKVNREKHRMEAFVRFQLTRDQLYYAIVQPDFNVLPLITKHFKDRYADQQWMIYDAMRKYGIYYDLQQVTEVQIDFTADLNNQKELKNIYDANEMLYQTLWQQYFSSVNIRARKNMKLHVQHMPKRYWKYLVEKHEK